MQSRPRNGASIDRIYIHTNEGPESAHGAANLATYLHKIDGGYHVIVDNVQALVVAGDDTIVWAAGGDNTHSLSLCLIGYASQGVKDWADAYSRAELELAAQHVAAWCQMYNVPVHDVAPGAPGQPPIDRGIAAHADDHSPYSGGHTDPGPNFPWRAFLARVQAILDEGKIDWKALKILGRYEREMAATGIHSGQSNWKVTLTKQLLAKHGPKYDVRNSHPMYGRNLVRAVHDFKHDKMHLHGDALDGHEAHGPFARAVLGIK